MFPRKIEEALNISSSAVQNIIIKDFKKIQESEDISVRKRHS